MTDSNENVSPEGADLANGADLSGGFAPQAAPTDPVAAVPAAPEMTGADAAPAVPESPLASAPAPSAPAPQNPFTAHQAAQPQPAQAPQPAGAAPQDAAAAPVQPYAVYEPAFQPAPQQAASPTAPAAPAAAPAAAQVPPASSASYQAAQPYQTAYGQAYGAAASYQAAGSVPPAPPAPTAPVYGYEPPAAGGQKRRWPWFLLGLAVGLVVGLGGCVSCVGLTVASYESSLDYVPGEGYDYSYDYDDDYSYDYENPYHTWPPEDDYEPYSDSDGATTLALTYNEVTRLLEAEGIQAGTPGADGACPKGYYTVGPNGDIPAGLYYLEGGDAVSHYYVFDGDGDTGKAGAYDLDDSVQYLGNYFAELDEGDLIAFDPAAEGAVMRPAPATSTEPAAPYGNGCYRVGIDIPAGTYEITALPLPEGESTDEVLESAAYVMDDLDFDDDSIVDTQYVIAGGKQTVTVADGQYLELFGAQAAPASQA